jgi:hypothetical protein
MSSTREEVASIITAIGIPSLYQTEADDYIIALGKATAAFEAMESMDTLHYILEEL